MDNQNTAALQRAMGMLEAILVRQIELHRSMLTVAADKREAIMKGDIQRLEAAVQEERTIITRIEEEENNRQALMPMLQKFLGLDSSVEKLADIISHMPEPEKTKLAKVRDQLKEILEECQRRTRHNAELLKASMEHVEAFLRNLTETVAKDANYGKNGRRSGGGPAFIDRDA